MAVSDIEAVLEFLRKNGLSESESALMEDILEKSDFRSFDFEKFLFPMVTPPPPVKTQATRGRSVASGGVDGDDSSSGSSEEFMSLDSSITDLCSSEFTNPYGIRTATRGNSQASSDRLSEFGTARDYHDFDMQNDMYWYNEKDEDYAMPPCFDRSDTFGYPSEDKFVMTSQTEKQSDSQLGLNHISEGFQSVGRTDYLDKPWPFNDSSMGNVNEVQVLTCSAPLCACCAGKEALFGGDPADYNLMNMKGGRERSPTE
ncbi:hypothetical protein F0562_026264 [Nyssa sinensis]|uniref:Uncharacterized protein n=1 Tax=Nyssa sinensis TaxID=561372 RepID=A0A5J5BCE5_9ASTE|nr:hypothetical protein F0562_026264 [Nyssa sinensis]